ncbi:MAG: class I SAM-dependent methyltransferase [Chitinophagaceae bacterium]|nr:class I SAM-dependent methyltransferase [Chitinophagaceae bacterium]
MCNIYKALESEIDFSKQENLDDIKAFKHQYYEFAKHSVLNTRILEWPKGYQGDNETLEYLYKGYPVSDNLLGKYIDLYAISRTLGVGIRERKEKLKELLVKEFFSADNISFKNILNIGCGSSKELYEIGVQLNKLNGKITCVDFDQDALNFSEITLSSRMIDMKKFDFKRLNVLKLVDPQFMLSNLGKFDIIYSVGLFDYIQDKGLIKIFKTLYANLNDGGKIIASFKDCNHYSNFDYHWLGNWDGFYQRTKAEAIQLLQKSIPGAEIEISKSTIEAINYYIIKKYKNSEY